MGEQVGAGFKWGCSSVGRAPALQAGGQEFESLHLHWSVNRKGEKAWTVERTYRTYLENRILNELLKRRQPRPYKRMYGNKETN